MQFEYLKYLLDWLAQNNAAAWAGPFLIAEAVALLVAMTITYWPKRFAGAITRQETWLKRNGTTINVVNFMIQLLAITILPIGIALMVFSPARPYALVLKSQANPSSMPIDQQILPDKLRRYRKINVTPIVQDALQRATDAGAGQWIAASAQQKDDLRKICLTVLTELRRDNLDQLHPSSAHNYQPLLPKWVIESTEISIVHGLCLQRNIRFAGVWTGPETPGRGWSVANRLPLKSRSEIRIFQSPPSDPVRVLSAFGGEAIGNTHVSFHVLISQLPASSSYQLPFRVVENATGKVKQCLYEIPPGPSTRIVKVEQNVFGFSATAHLEVELDDGRICTQLPLTSRGPQIEIAVFGKTPSQVSDFQKTWENLLGIATDGTVVEVSPLRENLLKAGRSIPRLSLNSMRGSNQLELHLDYPSSCLSLLEAGLEKSELNETLFQREKVPQPQYVPQIGSELTIVQSAWRVTEQFEADATMDSWVSTTALVESNGSKLWVPTSHATATVLSSALRANAPISEGRYFVSNSSDGGAEVRYPFVETHRIAKRGAVVIRLDSDEQQLFLPNANNTAGKSKYEYARSAALINSIILAAHRLSRRQVSNKSDLVTSQASGQSLLDLNSCVVLTNQRVEPSDDRGLLCIATFCLFATATGLIWHMPHRASTDSSTF